jgi:UDP-N-acetylmuramoyl-tripeptide--D-alanyl-D-alanine ligase
VYACGQLFFRVRDALPTAKYFETRDELIREIIKNPVRQATILIKASRGMGFERVMDVLPND